MTASIAATVALIGKAVSRLNSLRLQCADTELKLEFLAAQLQTVQAALGQVEAVVSDCFSSESQHLQLVAALERALGYCSLLVEHIDNRISKLWTPGCSLKVEAKIHLFLEDKAIDQYLTWLDHQLAALNLCLTAFKWYGAPWHLFKTLTSAVGRPVSKKHCLSRPRAVPFSSRPKMMQHHSWPLITRPALSSPDQLRS